MSSQSHLITSVQAHLHAHEGHVNYDDQSRKQCALFVVTDLLIVCVHIK